MLKRKVKIHEVRKPDLVIMKMWQELAIERSREIEKLQSKLEEANFQVAAEKSWLWLNQLRLLLKGPR